MKFVHLGELREQQPVAEWVRMEEEGVEERLTDTSAVFV